MEDKITSVVIEKLIFPLILGIVGWFVKDFLFAVYARRDELVRKEWERRLVEIWSPLYYWSGIVMFSGKEKGWQRHGMKELESILTRSAHLLPAQHYNNLIKLMQMLTGQTTSAPRLSDLRLTRQFIHNQVVTFNYLLYRRNGWYEATTYTDFFASVKYLVRFTSQALKHVLVWLMVVLLFGGTYLAFVNKIYWIVVVVLVVVLVPIAYDWYRQIKLHELVAKQGNR
jgi:hypothetical protein